jgi:hypothetical protein
MVTGVRLPTTVVVSRLRAAVAVTVVASRRRVAAVTVGPALQADARQAVTAAFGHQAGGMAAAGHRVEVAMEVPALREDVRLAVTVEAGHRAAGVVAEAAEAGHHRAAAAVSAGC